MINLWTWCYWSSWRNQTSYCLLSVLVYYSRRWKQFLMSFDCTLHMESKKTHTHALRNRIQEDMGINIYTMKARRHRYRHQFMESKTHAWMLIHGKWEYAGMHINTWKARRPMHRHWYMKSNKTCIYIGVQFVLALSTGCLVRGLTINLEAACILWSWSLKQPYFVDLYSDLLIYCCFLEISSLMPFYLQAVEWVPPLSAQSGSIKNLLRYFKVIYIHLSSSCNINFAFVIWF